MASPTADALDRELRQHADPERAAQNKRYLRSDLVHLGVRVPAIHAIASRSVRMLAPERAHVELIALATDLWDEPTDDPVFERRLLAADVLATRTDLLTPADMPVLERLCREASTWAIIDTLAPRVVGPLATRYPDDITPTLDAWAADSDFWLRRSALLSDLVALREGRGDWERFTRHADSLLDDREFFVAKAIGWVLRDTGRRRPEMVLAWVEPRIASLQAVTAREAVKPFDPQVRERLMAARRAPATRRADGAS